jgi:hypothetical protein
MNKNQKIVTWIADALILLACTFPPWKHTFQSQGISQVSKPAGYRFFFEPPSPQFVPFVDSMHEKNRGFGVSLDFGRLSIDLFVIIIIGGILILSLMRNPEDQRQK